MKLVIYYIFKITRGEAAERTQPLRTPAALAEDVTSLPKHPCDNSLSVTPGTRADTHRYTYHTYRQTNIHITKINKSKKTKDKTKQKTGGEN